MTLSSVNKGFVLLRDLWEHYSILKYRYKKLKAYRITKMKHLLPPQAKDYKPNLVMRMVKDIYESQIYLWSRIFRLFKISDSKQIKSEDWYRANGWTKQESHTQIPSSWNPPRPSKQKERKITHIRFTWNLGHHAFTKGNVYSVDLHTKFDNSKSEYINVIGDVPPRFSKDDMTWCFKIYDDRGNPMNEDKFELIYDNIINKSSRGIKSIA